jgi:hypothetical protein
MKAENLNIQNSVGIVIIVIVLYFLFLKPLFKQVTGKNQTDVQIISKKSSSKSPVNNAFDAKYFAKIASKKKEKPTEMLKQYGFDASKLLEIAKELKGAKGFFNDDETLVYNIFAGLPNLFVTSAVAFTFKNKYGIDLQTYLESFLNDKEYKNVIEAINAKKSL